jgi:hypothetical protein
VRGAASALYHRFAGRTSSTGDPRAPALTRSMPIHPGAPAATCAHLRQKPVRPAQRRFECSVMWRPIEVTPRTIRPGLARSRSAARGT